MRAVLLSIKPQWCELIASGKKTVEVRKTMPNIDKEFKVYIYCTGGPPYLNSHNGLCYLEDQDTLGNRGPGLYRRLNRRIIGEYVCKDIFPIRVFEDGIIQDYMWHYLKRSLVPYDDIVNYIGKGKTGFGWNISNLVIYENPKELSVFRSRNVKAYIGENGYPMPTHEIRRPPMSWCYVEEVDS